MRASGALAGKATSTTVRLITLAVMAMAIPAWGQIQLPDGFVAQVWLEDAGDLKGMAVGPGGDWGDDLYVYRSSGEVLRVTGQGAYDVFATGMADDAGDLAFDPHGFFGWDMYVTAHENGSGPPDRVYRCQPDGTVNVFFDDGSPYDLLTTGIAFGQGGFGPSLYVPDARSDSLLLFQPGGGVAHFGSGLGLGIVEDDLVISAGGALGNNAYVTDFFGEEILKMAPDGSVSVFAPGPSGEALALGEGVFGDKLYYGTMESTIYAYDGDGASTLFASDISPLTGAPTHPDGSVQAIAIDGDVMWVATRGGGPLLRISLAGPGDFNSDGDVDVDDIDLLCDNLGDAAYDLDGDGDADADDLVFLVENLVELQDGSGRIGTAMGDFNLDGFVDATDLAILETNFGAAPPAAAVPEPATMGILAFGAVGLLRQRRT